MEFRVLGPLEILAGDRRVSLGALRQQIVLARLLLDANRVVPVARLADAIYGENPPSTARAQTQTCISALRRRFAHFGYRDVIVTGTNGYELRVDRSDIDLHRFEDLLAKARQAREARQLREAAETYRSALGLWRGAALEGIHSQMVESMARQLDDRRIAANEECIEVELSLGRYADLAGELTGLIREYPLRERLRGHLMVALYRSGRQAEALEVYRQARQTMVDEFGIEPNEWLQRLERAILTSDPSLQGTRVPEPIVVDAGAEPPGAGQPVLAVPNMLPTDIADFTGRTPQLGLVSEHLALAREHRDQRAVPVVVVVGKPGVGKTTLAVHAAYREINAYPDGQLFADLHGHTAQRVGPTQVLGRFLRALGVPGNALPAGLDERAELYRDLLSDRRVLIVLDNVGSEAQIAPLLPGNSRSGVLVTCIRRLAALPGAVHVNVDVLESGQSVELLSRIVGADRVRAEPDTALQLVTLCGHLPLALRIAGARLAARPRWTMGQLAGRLADEARRLDELRHGGMEMRASLCVAYEAIGPEARRLFRRLAILDCPTFSAWVAAGLLDTPVPESQDLLDDLADAQLVEARDTGYGLHSQYRLHDLIRVFARERLVREEDVSQRDAALERVLGGLLFLLSEAHRRIHGGDYLQHTRSDAGQWPVPAPLAAQIMTPLPDWFWRERTIIVAGVEQAAEAGLVDLCWDIAVTAVTLFEAYASFNDWRETHEVALRAVRQGGNRRGEAAVLYSTGSLAMSERRFPQARQDLDEAARLFRSVRDEQGEALAVRNIAYIDRISGDLPAATRRYEQTLGVFRRGGDLVAAAYVLHSLAQVKLESGEDGTAGKMLAEALTLSRNAGSRRVEAQVLHRLGDLHLQAGEPRAAVEAFRQALDAVRDIGDQVGEAYVMQGLGLAYLRTGELDLAGTALRDALEVAGGASDALVEVRARLGLAELAMAQGLPAGAVVHLRRALDLLREVRAPMLEAQALAMLSETGESGVAPGPAGA